ncbi:MAG: Type I HSP40 co-chaperone [Chaenotheca gracillima]|nr:MAG: Type I HSP40 co-chaperone [Chaenotheca gracillima]
MRTWKRSARLPVTPQCLRPPLTSSTCAVFHQLSRWHASRPLTPRPALFQPVGRRGAKRITKISAADLPQGLVGPPESEGLGDVPPAPPPVEEEEALYPPVVQQARNNMRRFAHCVLVTRVGGFYELYFEHAEKYGPLLGLKVASKRTSAGPVPMAGFPVLQLDRFLKLLLQDLNMRVAISEEFANTASDKVKSGGLLFDRKVARIITPGTLIDEQFMNPFENNFLLAVQPGEVSSVETVRNADGVESGKELENQTVGLAWLDLSTGDFFTQLTTSSALSSAVARIGPRELIFSGQQDDVRPPAVESILEEYQHICTFHEPNLEQTSLSDWDSMLENDVHRSEETQFSPEEIKAGSSLLEYVQAQLQGMKMRFQPPIRRFDKESMSIDKHSLRALEIKSTLRDGLFKGSLLHAIRKTVTSSGARLLANWLISPSTSLSVIDHRLNLVSLFLRSEVVREAIVQQLRRSYDSQRLVQKFALGRGNADDLIALSKTIEATYRIVEILRNGLEEDENLEDARYENQPGPRGGNSSDVDSILSRLNLDGPRALAKRIEEAIDEDSVSQKQRLEDEEEMEMADMARGIASSEGSEADLSVLPKRILARKSSNTKLGKSRESEYDEPWVMRRAASRRLATLHDSLETLKVEKTELEEALRVKHGASSLTLRWTPGLGHICHLKGKDTRSSISSHDTIRSVGSSRTTRSLHLPEWTELGLRIDSVKMQIRNEEQRVFADLREEAVRNLVKLRRNAAVLDELDIACSFATSAHEQGLVRPILNLGTSHKIIGGRHPMVETGLGEHARTFVSNDCFVGDQERIWLITGPNMAGKSTFLRQNALISILAQVGSFVPAEYAELGIVDAIFSRIGSSDNLYEGQSTFMVEMLETAAILQKATPRSFVIMDEVGRGTTPEDGIAVSYACLHHLHHVNRCRALFATHFHDLADMAAEMEGLGFYCTDIVVEKGGGRVSASTEEDEGGSRGENFSYVHRLRRGVNRESHALKVAKLAGLPVSALKLAAKTLEKLKAEKASG